MSDKRFVVEMLLLVAVILIPAAWLMYRLVASGV